MPALAEDPRYNFETYRSLAPKGDWHTVAGEGLPLKSGVGEDKHYTHHQATTAVFILALLNPEPIAFDLRRFGLHGKQGTDRDTTQYYAGGGEANYMRTVTNSEVEIHDFLQTIEYKALEVVRLKAPPVGVAEGRTERNVRLKLGQDIYASLKGDHDAFRSYVDAEIKKVRISLSPIHSSDDVPNALLSPLQGREEARFDQRKEEASQILRDADTWTAIPPDFTPMELYHFMSISEQEAFWRSLQ